ncbi:unnamed protein product [Toxocara canis]|uniref:Protein kinase domain-containing protein n=1 Tax=Toxocara canis TaxID=6265 RepID=A0A183VH88_TOXCA|nr:unnamed protein product [Toxocara canis]
MVDAVFYLHEVAEMLHRDIKSDNVFLMVTDQENFSDIHLMGGPKGTRVAIALNFDILKPGAVIPKIDDES